MHLYQIHDSRECIHCLDIRLSQTAIYSPSSLTTSHVHTQRMYLALGLIFFNNSTKYYHNIPLSTFERIPGIV